MQTRAHHPIICLGSKACASGSRRCECKCPCTVAQWFLVWKPLVPPCLPKSIQKQLNFNILNHAQSASSLSKYHRLFCAYRDSMLKKTSNQGLHVVMHTHRRPRRQRGRFEPSASFVLLVAFHMVKTSEDRLGEFGYPLVI